MLVHHSGRGSQYTAIIYIERLAEAGIQPWAGSAGNIHGNARAEIINGFHKYKNPKI